MPVKKKPRRNYGRRVAAGTIIRGCKGCPWYRWVPDNTESNTSGESTCACMRGQNIAWNDRDPKIPKWCPLPKPKRKPRVPAAAKPQQPDEGTRIVAGTRIRSCIGCPYCNCMRTPYSCRLSPHRKLNMRDENLHIPEWCKLKVAPTPKPKFVAGTGLMGATASGQRVTTLEEAEQLPPGSVIRLDDKGRLIHLHDGLWLYCCDVAWCYDRIRYLTRYLPGTLCHMPRSVDVRRIMDEPLPVSGG
jgi:hypothetical protein